MVTGPEITAVLRDEIGTTERGYTNDCPYNDWYYGGKWGKKYNSDAAWCVVLQCWALMKLGAADIAPKTASVDYFFTHAAKYGMKKVSKSSIKKHMWVRHTYSHISWTTSDPKKTGGVWRVRVVAGNTSPGSGGSQRDGGGVWEKWVPLSQIQYAYQPKLGTESTTTRGILDMGISNAGQVKKAVAIPKGKWIYLPVNDSNDKTVLSGLAKGDGWLAHGNFTFTGVPAGKNVQVRFVLDSFKKGTTTKRIATYPPQELPSDGGKTMGAAFQVRKNVHSPGSGRTLRVRVQAWVPYSGVKLAGALYAAGK